MATNSKSLRYREVSVEGVIRMVPSGIARNNRNKCWQVKVEKNGVVVLKGNYTDELYGGAENSLRAAVNALTSKLATIEIAVGGQPNPVRNESNQLTARSSLIWRITPEKTTLQVSIYDKSIKKNRSVYIGTANTLVSKRGLAIQKIATALVIDGLIEKGQEPGVILSVSDKAIEQATSVYEEYIAGSPHVRKDESAT